MGKVKNVLFIMCDQLRADHLSCAGHPHLKTPAIDALAARGVRFPRAYVQSGVCGPSRMSFYTGRYMFEPRRHAGTACRCPCAKRPSATILMPAGIKVALAGKTHVLPDLDGAGAFRHRGRLRARRAAARRPLRGDRPLRRPLAAGRESGYPDYLRQHGYISDDPWSDFVISADGPGGEKASGWFMRNVHLPARVKEEHSRPPT